MVRLKMFAIETHYSYSRLRFSQDEENAAEIKKNRKRKKNFGTFERESERKEVTARATK